MVLSMQERDRYDYSNRPASEVVQYWTRFTADLGKILSFQRGKYPNNSYIHDPLSTFEEFRRNERFVRQSFVVFPQCIGVRQLSSIMRNKCPNKFTALLQHPNKPNYPKQKYLLTAKGLALYNEIKMMFQHPSNASI